jgi:hypothetical protein
MEMVKSPRNPLLGYNHNVKYGGHIFHVQTEDSGPGNPHVFTHLFFEGSILASKRGQYDPSTAEDEVRTLMQTQHKAILKELKQSSFNERISRFFAMRGETFPAEDFFGETAQTPAPAEALVTPPPDVRPAPIAPTVEVLDLDALPIVPAERAVTPEPLPIHVTKPAIPGPGTYTFRRPVRERGPNEPETTPPPQSLPSMAPTPPPVTMHPNTPVILQRQVIVGGGATPPPLQRTPSTMPVRRRPISTGPYVVKEGSHSVLMSTSQSRPPETPPSTPAAPPPRPLVPAVDPANAPRTASPQTPVQDAAPNTFVTDQSLDDVILAYLSQGEGKR